MLYGSGSVCIWVWVWMAVRQTKQLRITIRPLSYLYITQNIFLHNKNLFIIQWYCGGPPTQVIKSEISLWKKVSNDTCSNCSEMAAFVLWFPDPVRSRPRLWFEREPVSMVHTGTRSLFPAASPHSPSPWLSPYTPTLQKTLPLTALFTEPPASRFQPFYDLTGTIPSFHPSIPEAINGGTASGGHSCHQLFWERSVTKEPVALWIAL